jgi:hypothetical protein
VNGSQGSHGALNAEAYSSTMIQFSRARSSPSQKPFSRRASTSRRVASSDATTALTLSPVGQGQVGEQSARLL